MEHLSFTYPCNARVASRVHVGVVASGDLEVLLEPSGQQQSKVIVTTSVDGFGAVWKNVLDRFFSRFQAAVMVEINDFGATPGLVMLRLEQAAEAVLFSDGQKSPGGAFDNGARKARLSGPLSDGQKSPGDAFVDGARKA